MLITNSKNQEDFIGQYINPFKIQIFYSCLIKEKIGKLNFKPKNDEPPLDWFTNKLNNFC